MHKEQRIVPLLFFIRKNILKCYILWWERRQANDIVAYKKKDINGKTLIFYAK